MSITNYIWDPETDNRLMETDSSNVTQAVYANEPVQFGNLVSQRRGSATRYFQFDALGSTRQLNDGSETVTDTFTYNAWGSEEARTGSTSIPFRWIGELGYADDEILGASQIRARVYKSIIARWSSFDPARFVDGVNLYLYSTNNPIAASDPSGELTITRVPQFTNLNPNCRRLNARVRWRFKTAPNVRCRTSKGFFIQHVKVHCFLCDCSTANPCQSDDYEYWEAFAVTAGRPNGPASAIDNASYRAGPPRGSYRQSGQVKFYCVAPQGRPRIAGEIDTSEIIPAPSGPVHPEGPCPTTSIDLPRVTQMPEFWKRPPADGPAGRRFAMYWNCCCKERWASATARP